jgi:hypothetical protein
LGPFLLPLLHPSHSIIVRKRRNEYDTRKKKQQRAKKKVDEEEYKKSIFVPLRNQPNQPSKKWKKNLLLICMEKYGYDILLL